MVNLNSVASSLPLLDIGSSLILIVVLSILRYAALRLVRNKLAAQPQMQRRSIRSVRNTYWLLLIIGMGMLWAPQLRTFALSITAIAVAVVVATKELILCFSGSFMRASSRAFQVGDWIEVGGVGGEVIDHNIFSTSLHEFDRHGKLTGQEIIFPNSLLLTAPVRNHSLMRNHLIHGFTIVTPPTPIWFERKAEIADIIGRHFAPYRAAAANEKARLERKVGLTSDDQLEKVRYATTDVGNYAVTVKLLCPAAAAGRLESAITAEILQLLSAAPAGNHPPGSPSG